MPPRQKSSGEHSLILLAGANSRIGGSVARGLMGRFEDSSILAIGRTPPPAQDSFQFVPVTAALDKSKLRELLPRCQAIVLSIGVIAKDHDLREKKKRKQFFQTNVGLSIEILERIFHERASFPSGPVEIHLVSSVLATFSRSGLVNYSKSKKRLEERLFDVLHRFEIDSRVYIWRLGYVPGPIHGEDRRRGAFFSTQLSTIEQVVSKISKPGIHYLPRWLMFPSLLLERMPFLIPFASKLTLAKQI